MAKRQKRPYLILSKDEANRIGDLITHSDYAFKQWQDTCAKISALQDEIDLVIKRKYITPTRLSFEKVLPPELKRELINLQTKGHELGAILRSTLFAIIRKLEAVIADDCHWRDL